MFDQFAVATLRMIFRDYLPKEMDFCLLPPLLDLPSSPVRDRIIRRYPVYDVPSAETMYVIIVPHSNNKDFAHLSGTSIRIPALARKPF